MEQSIIADLKQTNVSSDPEKTKERTEQLWKSTNTATQKEVLKFLGLRVSSIYRAYKTGNISAKIVVALSQVCNVNPYYLTGESDDHSESSEELLKEFLISHGYKKLFDVTGKERKRSLKNETLNEIIPGLDGDSSEKQEKIDIISSILAFAKEKYDEIPIEQREGLESLSLEDIDTLLKALLIRARSGEKNAELEKLIKLLLLS